MSLSWLTPKFLSFGKDEYGGATVLGIFWTLFLLMLGGLALDYSNAVQVRTKLQGAADSAVLAAAVDIRNETTARTVAEFYVNANYPGFDPKNVDTILGNWDDTTKTFTASALPVNAMSVQLARSEENGNAIPTFLLKFVGMPTLSTNVQATAIAGFRCDNSGFFAAGIVNTGSSNGYDEGFCLYGRNGVSIGSKNTITGDSIIGMLDASDFNEGSENGDAASYLKEYEADIDLPGQIPSLITGLKLSTDGLPDYIVNGPVPVDSFPTDPVPYTLYNVAGDVKIPDNTVVENVAIVTDRSVSIQANVTLRNVTIVSGADINTGKGTIVGTSDSCTTGEYGVTMAAQKNFNFGGDGAYRGALFVSGQKLNLGSNITAMQGVYAEATGNIDFGSADNFGGCSDGLTSGLFQRPYSVSSLVQ